MSDLNRDSLPRGWASVRLRDVVRPLRPKVPPSEFPDLKFIGMEHIGAHTTRLLATVPASTMKSSAVYFQPGDILYGRLRPYLNKVHFADFAGLCSAEFIVLTPDTCVDARLLLYLLNSSPFVSFASGLNTGDRPRVDFDGIGDYRFAIPPSAEQRRIVDAIESVLPKLDAAVAALERVRANLRRYRASVLKAAVEGRLVPTEAELARKEGRDFEPASALLDRILAERRRRWEQSELAKMKAAGRPPKDDIWKAKYKEPIAPDTSTLPRLPDGWCWSTIDQLGEVSGGLTKNQAREQLTTRLPYLRVANVYANELRLGEVLDIGVEASELARVRLQPGDLLVVEGNGSSDQIGRVALWDGSIDPCVHQNHLIKVRFSFAHLSSWTLCWLLSLGGRLLISRVASSTSGLNTLSISKVERLAVPLSPLAEQARVISEMERRESVTAEAIRSIKKSEMRVARLRQSALKWAFEGKLVDQNPSDEPASLLLERIRAERAAAAPSQKSRKSNAHEVEAAK